MKPRNSQISESEESEEEAQTSRTKNVQMNCNGNSSSDASSDSEASRRAPSPPKHVPTPGPKKKVILNPFEKFLAANPGLNKLVVNNVVTEDDDVCLLEVPAKVDPAYLMERVIKFDSRTKIKLEGNKYAIEPAVGDIKPLNILTTKLRVINPIAVLRMQEYKKQKQESEVLKSEVSRLILPDDLKTRHAIFGSKYKRKIALSQELQKKLEDAIDETVHTMKKKKHKMVEDVSSYQTPVEPNDSGQNKKCTRRKKKHSFREECEHEETQYREESGHEHKETQLEGEESIFAMLENHIAHKKKVKENTVASSEPTDYEEHLEEINEPLESSPSKKKKKKRKDRVKEETVEEEHSDRRKRQNSINRELIESGYDVSDFQNHSSQTEKKTKHKNISFKEEAKSRHPESSIDEDFNLNESKLKKKKKKHNLSVKEEIISPSELNVLKFSTPIDSVNRMRRNSVAQETKKPNRLSIANSTVLPGLQLPSFEFDVSSIMNKDDVTRNEDEQEHHKKKHRKEKLPDEIREENTQEHQKKKSKKDKSLDLDGEVKKERIKKEYLTAGESGSEWESSPKKRKKKKRDVEEEEEEEAPVPKKKKVKVKEEKQETDPVTSSLISDLLSRVRSEMNNSTNHHGKRVKSEK